ncbi:hypothetical protein F5876DRAFT_80979 [Lentinula aff. lateritia]|uniref:Uncharacterized protein n=1 Tax=Lentinula aff. lateritia TaxID=2804960 RepID=A0ACC1TNH0_9AGAR|nr:hypothetical protein F5876DRAFT_80979 [Lentinula aff. lateritia]
MSSHRVKMSISTLLNPVTRNEDRSQNGDDRRTINWRNINANFRHPHRKPRARRIPVVDSTPFEIPTVSMQFLSRLSCKEPELSRYPLIAAYISCKLVSLVKFQRPLSKRLFVLKEIYGRIHYVLCDIGCSSKLALSSVLYMLRIFPDGIPYSGIRDHNCVYLVVRLFLLGFQLSIAWFHDHCCTLTTWSKFMGLRKKDVFRLEQAALQVLGYTLFISPSAWNGFMEQIHEDCPLFLYPVDFENLRQIVRSSHIPVHIARPEQGPRELAATGTIFQAEIEYHRLRISECAVRGNITVSPNQDTESSRIEAGTEEDYLLDVFDAAEELLFEELVESDQLLPPLPRFLPWTSTNVVSKQTSTSILPPQSHPSSSSCSSPPPPPPGTCLSPVIKIEEVEVELVWPSLPDNAVSLRDQRSEQPTRRESLRELNQSSCFAEPYLNSKPVLFSSTNTSAVAGRQSILAHSLTESFNESHSDSRYAVPQGISDMSPNSIVMHSISPPPPSTKGQSIPETATGSGRLRYTRFETPASPIEYHNISPEAVDMLVNSEVIHSTPPASNDFIFTFAQTNSGVFPNSGRFPALASPVHHNTFQGVIDISIDSGVLHATPLPTNVPSRTDAGSPTTEYRSPGQFQTEDLSSQKREDTLTTDLNAPQLTPVTLPVTRSSNASFSSSSGVQLVNQDRVSSVLRTPPAPHQSTLDSSLFSFSPLSPLLSIFDDSDCEAEDGMVHSDELYRSYTGAHLDVQTGHSESQVRVRVRFRTPEEGTQIEEEEEVDYCHCSEYEDDGCDLDFEGSRYSHVSSYSSSAFDSPHLSQLFSLSPLSPLSTTYDSDVEIDNAEEIDEEERNSEDNFEDDSDFDSGCSYASSTSAPSAFDPSVSPPPFKIPDTYDRETGLWTIPSPKSTEELGSPGSRHIRQEERPFDFTSAASTPDIKDEFYSMSHYGPISLGQGGFADGTRAPSPHPLDLEAELIHREFFLIPS